MDDNDVDYDDNMFFAHNYHYDYFCYDENDDVGSDYYLMMMAAIMIYYVMTYRFVVGNIYSIIDKT